MDGIEWDRPCEFFRCRHDSLWCCWIKRSRTELRLFGNFFPLAYLSFWTSELVRAPHSCHRPRSPMTHGSVFFTTKSIDVFFSPPKAPLSVISESSSRFVAPSDDIRRKSLNLVHWTCSHNFALSITSFRSKTSQFTNFDGTHFIVAQSNERSLLSLSKLCVCRSNDVIQRFSDALFTSSSFVLLPQQR